MGGGGIRGEETGQLAGRTRGTKGNGCNERRRQMGGGGVRSGNMTTSRTTRGLEGQDEWSELSVNTADGSLMVRYGATAPRRRKGWRDGSSMVRDSVQRLFNSKGQREHRGHGLRAQRQWVAMERAMVNGW